MENKKLSNIKIFVTGSFDGEPAGFESGYRVKTLTSALKRFGFNAFNWYDIINKYSNIDEAMAYEIHNKENLVITILDKTYKDVADDSKSKKGVKTESRLISDAKKGENEKNFLFVRNVGDNVDDITPKILKQGLYIYKVELYEDCFTEYISGNADCPTHFNALLDKIFAVKIGEITVKKHPILKTINFYSYKGGVGRTTLTSQIARCLAALGKKVVILDMDFKAPGFPVAFGEEHYTLPKNGSEGLCNLMNSYRKHSEGETQKIKNLKESLEKCLISAVIKLRGVNNKGSVQILPCAKINETYRNNVLKGFWLNDTESDSDFLVNFISEELKSIFNSMGIDYLLIDSTSGISNYSRAAQRVSDVQTIIFCPNDETNHAVEKFLFNEIKDVDDLNKFVFVISRIPPELSKKGDDAFEKTKKTIIENVPEEKPNIEILKLHSDIDTHLDSQIRMIDESLKDGKEKIVQLHEDIFIILASLCPELCEEFCEKNLCDDDICKISEKTNLSDEEKTRLLKWKANVLWKQIFGKELKVTHINRLFWFFNDHSEMLNPEDEKRNIAFKVDTFIEFLNNFYETLKGHNARKATELLNVALLKAGKQCGAAFGEDLKKLWGFDDSRYENPDFCIEEWCGFDSRAGFGQMIYENQTIKVYNAFIQNEKIVDKQDYTAFFSGYVIGVLEILLGDKLLSVSRRIIQKYPHKKESYSDCVKIFISGRKTEDYLYPLRASCEEDIGIEYEIEMKSEDNKPSSKKEGGAIHV